MQQKQIEQEADVDLFNQKLLAWIERDDTLMKQLKAQFVEGRDSSGAMEQMLCEVF